MKFSIDILWFDKNFKVITIKENVAPETYPAIFQPSARASYVVEANAGFAKEYNIKTGDTLEIR
jgi:uncharacterized membrane protein (UPF0127 family)